MSEGYSCPIVGLDGTTKGFLRDYELFVQSRASAPNIRCQGGCGKQADRWYDKDAGIGCCMAAACWRNIQLRAERKDGA